MDSKLSQIMQPALGFLLSSSAFPLVCDSPGRNAAAGGVVNRLHRFQLSFQNPTLWETVFHSSLSVLQIVLHEIPKSRPILCT